MHIMFIADASSPHSYRWIKYFSERENVTVSWCSLTKNTMPVLNNVHYKIFDGSFLSKLKAIRYILSAKVDLIHVHYLGWNGLLSLVAKRGIPIVSTAWGSDIVFNSKNISKDGLSKR